jgi:hypothetical protein
MNINTIYRHPAELEAEAMLSRKKHTRMILRWQTEQQNA